ncbi:hypothetical protein HPB48_001476 [Haemaphysalis longicornis]|uniref:Ig-like domain-containing protein n=1 Tax=Haemaphysalis longicornis TaxID=44386 RepID=A0A9J6FFW6_HAELO|nr:hypothetical protein HPB48_001476 [Haemaphysalis longicornis]
MKAARSVQLPNGGKWHGGLAKEGAAVPASAFAVLKPAQAKWLRSTSRVDAYRRLQLRCKLNGNPIPWVQWYFMGKPVTPNARVHIVTKWRRSRLEIKSARRQDSGLYECRAWNVLRKEPSTVSVSVSVRDRYPPPSPEPTRAAASTTTNGRQHPKHSACTHDSALFGPALARRFGCLCATGVACSSHACMRTRTCFEEL